ncbi:uncharacterized protein LOC124118683 [Haliotis rufescens]|uniref:uncharacterized protein LOC124118683 n=1 Tax=Haliotis rufescens TaxID=6454 RepID=UPI00201FB20F|nr:uncharacterized protein LOC124118683 [Haliotis rufescens]
MSYKCRKHDVNNNVQTEPLYSVLDSNLVACAVSCYRNNSCLYFVYISHNKRCDGYEENRCDVGEDDGTAGMSVGSLGYKHTCKKRCEKRKAKYNVHLKTGRERNAGSKADLVLTLEGWCGQVRKELTNGKDIRLRKGRVGTLKFIADSVCGVKTIGVAFSDPCHKDDWLMEYVEVVTVEMATRNRDRKTLQTNYWLSAHGDDEEEEDDEHTTGIKCVNVQFPGFISIIKKQYATCRSYQICG